MLKGTERLCMKGRRERRGGERVQERRGKERGGSLKQNCWDVCDIRTLEPLQELCHWSI